MTTRRAPRSGSWSQLQRSTTLPNELLVGGRNLSGAYLYATDDGLPLADKVARVERALQKLMKDDLKIEAASVGHKEAAEYFEKHKMRHSLALIKSRVSDPVPVQSPRK